MLLTRLVTVNVAGKSNCHRDEYLEMARPSLFVVVFWRGKREETGR